MFAKLGKIRQGILHIDRHLKVPIPQVPAGDRRVEANLLNGFWHDAWRRFEGNCPDASKFMSVITEQGEKHLQVDHVALRTFNLPNIDKEKLGNVFERHGYLKVPEVLTFPDKHLEANYFVHPDDRQPKVFVSELLVTKLSPQLQKHIWKTAGHIRIERLDDFLTQSWAPPRHQDYLSTLKESEYAGWVTAFGLQINHFAFLTNKLNKLFSLEELNRFLTAKRFELNSAGGLIKGTETDLLRQSSTMAAKVCGRFNDGYHSIPGCFLEFTQRYQCDEERHLFEGFRSSNANRIFESTNDKKV